MEAGSSLDLPKMQRRVVLSDGGVYDNLGLGPVWKAHELVLCSDGGKRWLVSSFEDGLYRGGYWGIGTEIEGYPQHGPGYSGIVIDRLRAVRTDLDAFSEEVHLVLMNHGWVLADAALRSYLDAELPKPIPPGKLPSPDLLKGDAAVRALADSDRVAVLGRG